MSKQHFKIKNGARIVPVTAFPSDAEEGDVVFRSDTNPPAFYVRKNNIWADIKDSTSLLDATKLTGDIDATKLAGNIAAARITSALNASGSAPIYACRAWVNFNGTGSTGANQTTRGSGNVSSVFKNGTGDYTINFATAIIDANYAVSLNVRNNPAPGSGANANAVVSTSTAQSSSSVRIVTGVPSTGVTADYDTIYVLIFR